MTLDELLKYINFISTKENKGLTYTEDNYNLNLPIAVQELYDRYLPEYERNKKVSDAMSVYEVVLGDIYPPLIVDSDGHATKPPDYQTWSSFYYKSDTTIDSVTITNNRPIEYVTSGQYQFRLSSKLRPIDKDYPIVVERAVYFQFAPQDLEFVEFTYLSIPEKPFYDYYYNADGEIVYMPPETSHTLLLGEEGRMGETSPVTVISESVELKFPQFLHLELALILLSKIGINLRDTDLLQYTELKQKEDEQRAVR